MSEREKQILAELKGGQLWQQPDFPCCSRYSIWGPGYFVFSSAFPLGDTWVEKDGTWQYTPEEASSLLARYKYVRSEGQMRWEPKAAALVKVFGKEGDAPRTIRANHPPVTIPEFEEVKKGSLCDLTSGSGDKGTPIVLVSGYFDNYADDWLKSQE